jgi:hypothetical protein
MPAYDRPYRIRNESSFKPLWRKLTGGFRARTELPRSLGFREQPWNPESRGSELINNAIGPMLAGSHRTGDLCNGLQDRPVETHHEILGFWSAPSVAKRHNTLDLSPNHPR